MDRTSYRINSVDIVCDLSPAYFLESPWIPREKRWHAVFLCETQAKLTEKPSIHGCLCSVDTQARESAKHF